MVTEIEQLIQEAVTEYRQGTEHRWNVCMLSEQIVGNYERGATMDLASRCGISVSMCEDYARAGLIWKTALSQFPEQSKQLERMRSVLPISHWTCLCNLWKRLEFELHDGLTLLEEVATEDKIITVVEWRKLLLGHFAEEGGTMDWEVKYNAVQSKIKDMLNDYGLPEEIREKAQAFLDEPEEAWTLVLSGEKPVSWNLLWSSKHWTVRQKLAQEVHARVRAALDPEIEPPPLPVDVTVVAYQKGTPMDPDNILAKPYLDGLKGWWLRDDSPDCVRSVRLFSQVDKNNPRVEIILIPCPGAKPWKVREEATDSEV